MENALLELHTEGPSVAYADSLHKDLGTRLTYRKLLELLMVQRRDGLAVAQVDGYEEVFHTNLTATSSYPAQTRARM